MKTLAPKKVRPGKPKAAHGATGGRWLLQDAKARFSELVRRVKAEGPQIVTVHGREEVVVVAAEQYRRLLGEVTGKSLIDILQGSPHREVDIAPPRIKSRARDVSL